MRAMGGRKLGDDLPADESNHLGEPTDTNTVTCTFGRTPRQTRRPYLVHTEEVTGSVPVSSTVYIPS